MGRPRKDKTIQGGNSSLDDAKKHLAHINLTIDSGDAGDKEMPKLFAQKTSVLRLIANLNGAMNVSESKIVRSEPFIRMMSELETVLANFPDAVAALKKWRDSYI